MELFDVYLKLDREKHIRSAHWVNSRLEELYASRWSTFLGLGLYDVFQLETGRGRRELVWNGERFHATLLEEEADPRCYLKWENDKVYLLERALDQIADGVQVYDKNACLLYLNSTSRKISDMPEGIPVEGRHLLDLYDLDEGISTVMTSLKERIPVVNRFDNFQAAHGSSIASTNTSYPVFKGKELVGAVVFEQDMNVVEAQLARLEGIRKTLRREAGRLSPTKFAGYVFDDIVGSGKKLLAAVQLAKRVAVGNSNVMLVGETGTGKEIFAQSIHKASPRSGKKFVPVNCAAVPETLAESFFFGTQKGSYTGSMDRPGLLEEANGGTLFLDELNSMSLTMQSKLLRAIQEGTFRRVGGDRDIRTDMRVISSCNEPPHALLAGNVIRKDLYYRLSTVIIDLPPLREHTDDIEDLVNNYIRQKSHHYAKPILAVSAEAMAILKAFHWPGNVRELFHALDYVLNVVDTETVGPDHLPGYIRDAAGGKPEHFPAAPGIAEDMADWYRQDLQHTMDKYECAVLHKVLEHHGYNISRTADALGLRRQSLQYRIKKFGIVI